MSPAVCIRRGLTTWPTCNCPPCRTTRRRLGKLARNGHFNRIPPEQGMAALLQMMNTGMTAPAIADATGISENTISNWLGKLRAGGTFRLGARACYLLTEAKIPELGLVGAAVPRRMLQALARIGWSCDELTRRVRAHGKTIGTNTLHSIRAGNTQRVRAWVANEITALYHELEMTPGQSDQTIRIAIARRWASPLAWDDDTIDDPKARPAGVRGSGRPHRHEVDEVAVLRAMHGDRTVNLTKAERTEVSLHLRADGWSFERIEAHTGLKAERYVGVAA